MGDKLVKNKSGKIVSKARSARGKKVFSSTLGAWNKAVAAARKALGIQGFCPMGGKSAQGKAFYARPSPSTMPELAGAGISEALYTHVQLLPCTADARLAATRLSWLFTELA